MEHLVVIAGPPGCGKGLVTRLLVQHYVNCHVFAVSMACSDFIRQAMAEEAAGSGATIGQMKGYADKRDARLPGWVVKQMYRRAMVRCTDLQWSPQVLIIDGIIRLSEAYASLSLALEHGLTWSLLYVDAPQDVMYRRVVARNRRNDSGISEADYLEMFVRSERGRQLQQIQHISTARIFNNHSFVNDLARSLNALPLVRAVGC